MIYFLTGYGGSGSFFTCEDFFGKFDESFPTYTFFFSFFWKWRSAHKHQFHYFRQDWSCCTSWDNCGRVFPDKLPASSFSLIGSHTMPGQHTILCPFPVVVSPKFLHFIWQSPRIFHLYLSISCVSSWNFPAALSILVFHVPLMTLSLPQKSWLVHQ